MAIDEVDITPSAKIFSDKSAMQRYSKQDGDNEHNWTYAFAEIVDNSIDSCKGRCAETGGRVKVSALRTPNNPLRVVIKFEADGNSAWVSVHDNGPGLKDLVSMLRLGERDEMKEHTIGGYGVGGKYAVNRLGARTFFASQDGGGTVRQALLDIDMILLDGWKAPVREDPEGEHVPVIESSKRGFERPVPSPWYEKTLNSAGVGETFTTVQISKLRNDVLKGLHFSFELLKARLEEMYVRQTIISRTLCLDFRGPSGPPVFRPIHELLEAQENQPATAPRPLEMKAVLKFGGEHPVSQKMTVVINYVPRRVATQSPGLRALLRPNVSPSHPEGDGEQEEQMEWGGRGRLTSQGVKGRSSLSPPSASSSSSSSGAGGGEGAEDQVVIDADALDDGEEESASSSSSSGQRRGHLIPFHCQTPVFAFYEDRMIPVDFREAPKLVSLALEQLNKRTEKSAIEAWQIVTFLLLEEPQAVSLSSSSSSSSGGKGTEGIRPTENKLGFEKLKKLKDAFNLLFRSQTASASAQEGDESPLKEVSFSLAQMDGQLKPMLEKRCDDLGIPWRASHLPSILACAMQLWWSSFENKYIWQRDSVTWPGSFRSFQITRAVSSAAARGRRTEKGPEVLDDLATSLVSAYDLVLARGSNRGRNGKVWVGASPHIAPVRVRPLSSAAAAAASGHDDCQEGDVEEEAESLWIDLNSLRAYREGGEESVRPRIFSGPVDEWQQRAASQEKTQEGHEEGGGAPEADLKESHITMTGRKGDIVVCALSGKVHAGFVGNVFLSKVLELDAQREGLKVQLQPEWMYAPLRNGALDSDGCLLVHLDSVTGVFDGTDRSLTRNVMASWEALVGACRTPMLGLDAAAAPRPSPPPAASTRRRSRASLSAVSADSASSSSSSESFSWPRERLTEGGAHWVHTIPIKGEEAREELLNGIGPLEGFLRDPSWPQGVVPLESELERKADLRLLYAFNCKMHPLSPVSVEGEVVNEMKKLEAESRLYGRFIEGNEIAPLVEIGEESTGLFGVQSCWGLERETGEEGDGPGELSSASTSFSDEVFWTLSVVFDLIPGLPCPENSKLDFFEALPDNRRPLRLSEWREALESHVQDDNSLQGEAGKRKMPVDQPFGKAEIELYDLKGRRVEVVAEPSDFTHTKVRVRGTDTVVQISNLKVPFPCGQISLLPDITESLFEFDESEPHRIGLKPSDPPCFRLALAPGQRPFRLSNPSIPALLDEFLPNNAGWRLSIVADLNVHRESDGWKQVSELVAKFPLFQHLVPEAPAKCLLVVDEKDEPAMRTSNWRLTENRTVTLRYEFFGEFGDRCLMGQMNRPPGSSSASSSSSLLEDKPEWCSLLKAVWIPRCPAADAAREAEEMPGEGFSMTSVKSQVEKKWTVFNKCPGKYSIQIKLSGCPLGRAGTGSALHPPFLSSGDLTLWEQEVEVVHSSAPHAIVLTECEGLSAVETMPRQWVVSGRAGSRQKMSLDLRADRGSAAVFDESLHMFSVRVGRAQQWMPLQGREWVFEIPEEVGECLDWELRLTDSSPQGAGEAGAVHATVQVKAGSAGAPVRLRTAAEFRASSLDIHGGTSIADLWTAIKRKKAIAFEDRFGNVSTDLSLLGKHTRSQNKVLSVTLSLRKGTAQITVADELDHRSAGAVRLEVEPQPSHAAAAAAEAAVGGEEEFLVSSVTLLQTAREGEWKQEERSVRGREEDAEGVGEERRMEKPASQLFLWGIPGELCVRYSLSSRSSRGLEGEGGEEGGRETEIRSDQIRLGALDQGKEAEWIYIDREKRPLRLAEGDGDTLSSVPPELLEQCEPLNEDDFDEVEPTLQIVPFGQPPVQPGFLEIWKNGKPNVFNKFFVRGDWQVDGQVKVVSWIRVVSPSAESGGEGGWIRCEFLGERNNRRGRIKIPEEFLSVLEGDVARFEIALFFSACPPAGKSPQRWLSDHCVFTTLPLQLERHEQVARELEIVHTSFQLSVVKREHKPNRSDGDSGSEGEGGEEEGEKDLEGRAVGAKRRGVERSPSARSSKRLRALQDDEGGAQEGEEGSSLPSMEATEKGTLRVKVRVAPSESVEHKWEIFLYASNPESQEEEKIRFFPTEETDGDDVEFRIAVENSPVLSRHFKRKGEVQFRAIQRNSDTNTTFAASEPARLTICPAVSSLFRPGMSQGAFTLGLGTWSDSGWKVLGPRDPLYAGDGLQTRKLSACLLDRFSNVIGPADFRRASKGRCEGFTVDVEAVGASALAPPSWLCGPPGQSREGLGRLDEEGRLVFSLKLSASKQTLGDRLTQKVRVRVRLSSSSSSSMSGGFSDDPVVAERDLVIHFRGGLYAKLIEEKKARIAEMEEVEQKHTKAKENRMSLRAELRQKAPALVKRAEASGGLPSWAASPRPLILRATREMRDLALRRREELAVLAKLQEAHPPEARRLEALGVLQPWSHALRASSEIQSEGRKQSAGFRGLFSDFLFVPPSLRGCALVSWSLGVLGRFAVLEEDSVLVDDLSADPSHTSFSEAVCLNRLKKDNRVAPAPLEMITREVTAALQTGGGGERGDQAAESQAGRGSGIDLPQCVSQLRSIARDAASFRGWINPVSFSLPPDDVRDLSLDEEEQEGGRGENEKSSLSLEGLWLPGQSDLRVCDEVSGVLSACVETLLQQWDTSSSSSNQAPSRQAQSRMALRVFQGNFSRHLALNMITQEKENNRAPPAQCQADAAPAAAAAAAVGTSGSSSAPAAAAAAHGPSGAHSAVSLGVAVPSAAETEDSARLIWEVVAAGDWISAWRKQYLKAVSDEQGSAESATSASMHLDDLRSGLESLMREQEMRLEQAERERASQAGGRRSRPSPSSSAAAAVSAAAAAPVQPVRRARGRARKLDASPRPSAQQHHAEEEEEEEDQAADPSEAEGGGSDEKEDNSNAGGPSNRGGAKRKRSDRT